MEPTLYEGERVITARFLRPRMGDLIVFQKNALIQIKRVCKIQGRRYFVRGDNINHSTDSLDFGAVDHRDIIGRVIFNY